MRPLAHRPLCLLLALAMATHAAAVAHAYPGAPTSPPTPEAKADAKKRFDKALAFFAEKNPKAALAELRHAYELTGNLVVLYNIGLVHDSLDEFVQADDALSEVLAATPDPLDAKQRKRALEVQAHARARIGTIGIAPSLAKSGEPPPSGVDPLQSAVVELDGIDVGRWPLGTPLRATIGPHVVGLLAPGYVPARASVSIAGETTTKVPLELVPMEGKVAQLTIVTSLPGAKIVVDGQTIGTTPLPSSIAVSPGKHVVELTRPGYATASTMLTLTSGGIGQAKLDPVEDDQAIASLGAKVIVRASEENATVEIDGRARDASNAIPLPPGAHSLHVERTGYFPFDREFDAPRAEVTTIEADLAPTPETRQREETIASHRKWGTLGVVSGAVLTAVGGGLFVWYAVKKSGIDTRTHEFADSQGPSGSCGNNHPENATQCEATQQAILSDRNTNDVRLGFAIGTTAVGLLSLGLGLYSFSTAPSHDRVEASASPLQISVFSTRSTYGLSLSGEF